ncbi:hypothetical protein DFH09DRAFT_1196326, partial [Mycena vulgaris]
ARNAHGRAPPATRDSTASQHRPPPAARKPRVALIYPCVPTLTARACARPSRRRRHSTYVPLARTPRTLALGATRRACLSGGAGSSSSSPASVSPLPVCVDFALQYYYYLGRDYEELIASIVWMRSGVRYRCERTRTRAGGREGTRGECMACEWTEGGEGEGGL